jgi:hypothetical protein
MNESVGRETDRDLRFLARLSLAALTLLIGWTVADLVLRVDLPGAARLAHAGFRGITAPLEWMTGGDQHRVRWTLAI